MTLRRFKTWLLPLCTACLLLAGWMVYHSLSGGQLAGCGAGSGCDTVMGSPWAWMLRGVPVSLPAALVYVLLIVCPLFLGGDSAEARSLDRLLWRLLPLLAGCIVGAALWFSYLQLFVLHAFCPYCTALHLLGCIVATIIMRWPVAAGHDDKDAGHDDKDVRHARPDRASPTLWFAAGLLAAALFAFVQSRTLPDPAYDSGRTETALPAFAEEDLPILESSFAGPSSSFAGSTGESITLLFDFQCIHCRRLHRILPELLERAGGQYRITLCPVPLSSACNPYIPASGVDRFAGSCPLTRYALAVWYALPDAYAEYWEYLLGNGDEHATISPADAENRARTLLGDGFEAALTNPRIDATLRRAEELFGRTSSSEKSGVPRLLSGQRWLIPETTGADELLELIRTEL